MRLIKCGHACVDVHTQGARVLIDPGSFSAVPEPSGIDAVVLTHAHGDHAAPELLRHVLTENPSAPVLAQASTLDAVAEVTEELGTSVTAVAGGDSLTVAGTTLRFTGGRHAPVHRSFDAGDNVGVVVDATLYHPGDSFTVPQDPVPVLALPVSGPWLKVGEVLDFLTAVRPSQIVPIHEVFLSEVGMKSVLRRVEHVAGEWGGRVLAPAEGDSLLVGPTTSS